MEPHSHNDFQKSALTFTSSIVYENIEFSAFAIFIFETIFEIELSKCYLVRIKKGVKADFCLEIGCLQ